MGTSTLYRIESKQPKWQSAKIKRKWLRREARRSRSTRSRKKTGTKSKRRLCLKTATLASVSSTARKAPKLLRMFVIAFTKRRPNQVRSTSYAQASQIHKIRKKIVQIVKREASTCELKDLVVKFIPESIGKQIEKECQGIY